MYVMREAFWGCEQLIYFYLFIKKVYHFYQYSGIKI